jgi:hypothetical protein
MTFCTVHKAMLKYEIILKLPMSFVPMPSSKKKPKILPMILHMRTEDKDRAVSFLYFIGLVYFIYSYNLYQGRLCIL